MKNVTPKPAEKAAIAENPMRAIARPIDLQTTAPAHMTAPHRALPQKPPIATPPGLMHPIVRGESVQGSHPTTDHILAGGAVRQAVAGDGSKISGSPVMASPIAAHIRANNELHNGGGISGAPVMARHRFHLGKVKFGGKKNPPTHQKQHGHGGTVTHTQPTHSTGNPGGGTTTAQNPIPDPGASQGVLAPQVGYVDASTGTSSTSSGSSIFIILGLGVVGVLVYLYFKHHKKHAAEAAK